MEEKINNQKIFSYIPSLIARLILNSNLQDKDIFSDNQNQNSDETNNPINKKKLKGKSTFLTSLFINPSIYPINHYLPYTIVMNIRLKGFQKLISTLSLKDQKNQFEKMISEYLSIITPKFLLKISEIISNLGGEIIKYNDYEFTTIWNFNPKKHKIPRYQKFYAKHALLSASEIIKELDNKEIVNGIKIKISIGIAMGETMIGFFGGERKRGEYIVIGETIQKAEICLNYCLSHEVIISEEVNALFKDTEEIITKEIDNKENLKLYLVTNFNERNLKNLRGFKIKMKSDKLNMTKTVYENLAKKVYIFSSILPQGLVKYLDVGQDHNLKEISVVTIATIHILIDKDITNNLKKIQNIILDIQKATYLTFGSLLYISKTYNGFLVRCVWGMDPGSFLDDTARCISTAILIGSLTEYYNIKIGIGIATGSCYNGLIPIQGNRKQFTLLGKKVNLSRTLADEAFDKVINSNSRKYIIYCDKKTVKQSQKWFRHIYISKINIYFNKESQELYYETKEDNNIYMNPITKNKIFNFCEDENVNEYNKKIEQKLIKNKRVSRSNTCLFGEYNRKNTELFKKTNSFNNSFLENINIIAIEIYSPIENEEYFLQNIDDPFPLLRTHKYNSYSKKINQYFYNHFHKPSLDNKINLNLIGNLPLETISNREEENKMEKKLKKSLKLFGYDKEINKFVNILNTVVQKNKKQFFLVKGPLGVGKSLFLRNVLYQFLESNEELMNIYYNKDDFIFFNIVDPLTSTFPYNIFCFILRKIFFYIKKNNKLKEINKLCTDLNLDNENIKNINFVLSMGKKDINIVESFELKERERASSLISVESSNNNVQSEIMSVISELEGPHKIKDSNKIDNFFFEMIKLYKIILNKKYNNSSSKSLNFKSGLLKTKNRIPLILVIGDIHMSDRYSMDFIRYLFNNDDNKNNPFIVILEERTPFSKNYRPILHRELEFFLTAFSDSDNDSNSNNEEIIGNDKIITFEINPFMERYILKDIIKYNYKNYVAKNYPSPSRLESIDDKILDFLLMKSFQGIPLLVLELFESLLKSQKFIKLIDNEFKITEELLDNNALFDWSDLLIPYCYEKITSMCINSLLSFKEILLLKYACTIGTIFDVQTLDKINPLNLIIKKEDLNDIMEKLNNEYIIEIFENERINRKSKKYLICKICFPFMREVLHKKYPIQQRAKLHAEIAKLLSGGKKIYYFNSSIEGKILSRHLIYSEFDVVKEIESKSYPDNIINSYKYTKILKSNNIKVLLVKDLLSRIYDKRNKNVIEGKLEALIEDKWIGVNYFIDRQWKIYFQYIKKNENEGDFEVILPIKDIFQNTIIDDNLLEITIIEYSFYILNESKVKVLFRSDDSQEIFNLNTELTFLKMLTQYDKYIYNFGYTKFPLYKTDIYIRKEKKYYAKIEQNQIVYFNGYKPFRKQRLFSAFGLANQTDKLITESKDINRPFNVIMNTAFSHIIAIIQTNINKNKGFIDNEEERIHGKKSYLIFISTPEHIKNSIQKYIDEMERKKKEEEELIRLRYKGKYSLFPLRLIKHERRIFGSELIQERRNQSISHPKINGMKDDLDEKKVEKEDLKKTEKELISFKERRSGKSKTILDKINISKELNITKKEEEKIEFVDNDSSEKNSKSESKSNSFSKNKSEKTENEKTSIYFSDSESKNSSQISSDNDYRKNDTNIDINNIKVIDPNKLKDKKNSINSNITDNNDEEKDSIKDNNILNFNNYNINNGTKETNIKTKNNYNINNYINNNININVINNDYMKSRIKNSLLNNNKNIINNNYNININSLRLSYQKKENKFLIKTKQKLDVKKSNSAKVKSLKEKYRNSLNYYLNANAPQKLSLDDDDEDEDEDSGTSDKESENLNSNLVLNPHVVTARKNSKIITDLIPTKADLFTKAIISFLQDEEKAGLFKKTKPKVNKSASRKKNKKKSINNISKSTNLGINKINKDNLKGKRSSLCPAIKFQFKNRNKHVTFHKKKTIDTQVIEENIKIRKLTANEDLLKNNNIKRITLYDKIDK